ncbi:MAG: iron-sulfur cluster assembly scaffold protein [Thermoguttaceae bacterium]
MAWEYSEKTKQLFMDAIHGKPGTHLGEITDPDGLGEHGSVACGDALRFTFRVERDASDPLRDVIVEARYLTFGCTSAIAASEALCCILEGKRLTPIDALKITNADIVNFLDGLPEQKVHCSVMGAEALQAAVFNWAQRRGVSLESLGIDIHTGDEEEGRIVCKCFSLSEPYLKRKIRELNLHSIAEVTAALKAGGACMSCHHAPGGLADLLQTVWGQDSSGAAKTSGSLALPLAGSVPLDLAGLTRPTSDVTASPREESLSPFQLAKKIEKVLIEYIRPMIQRDGGDLNIIDIKDFTVFLELQGACASCAGAGSTIKYLVERTLKEQVDERLRVVQV